MRFRLIALGMALLLFSGVLFGQSDRASITGEVKDPSGALVAGVEVNAINVGTNISTTALSNDLGLYTITNLPIGQYTLVFKHEGFRGHRLDRSSGRRDRCGPARGCHS